MINIEKNSAPRAIIGKHLTSLIEKNNKIIVKDYDIEIQPFAQWDASLAA